MEDNPRIVVEVWKTEHYEITDSVTPDLVKNLGKGD